MNYNKPIISEVYSEFSFSKIISSQQQFDIVQKFKIDSDILELIPIQEPEIGVSQRYRLWGDNKRTLIQVLRSRVLFNYIPFADEPKKYEGWDSFLKKCIKIQEDIQVIVKENSWKHVGICYVNKIDDIPLKDFTLGKYINCSGEIVPVNFSELNSATDLIVGIGNINIEENNQLKIKLELTPPDTCSIRLESLYNCFVNDDNVEKQLNYLHNKCSEVFNSLITEYTKNKIMGGYCE